MVQFDISSQKLLKKSQGSIIKENVKILVIIINLKMSWCSITVGISAAMIVIY